MTKVEELISLVQALPQEAVNDLLAQARNWSREAAPAPPYKPVVLGGLWQGVSVPDDELQAVRDEMWKGFGRLDERS